MSTLDRRSTRLHAVRLAFIIGHLLFCVHLQAQLRSQDISQYFHTSWRAAEGSFRGSLVSITQSRDGYLWLAGTSGALRFDGVRFAEWTPPKGESLPLPLNAIYGSSDGSVWFGGSGVSRLSPDGTYHRFTTLDNAGAVNSLQEDASGAMWVGLDAEVGKPPLFRIAQDHVRTLEGSSAPRGRVFSLFVNRKGNLLAAALDGIWDIHTRGSRKLVGYPDFRDVGDLNEDEQGRLLFADGEALKELSPSGTLDKYRPFMGLRKQLSCKLLRTRNGDLWMATEGSGLIHEHAGRVDTFSTRDGLSAAFSQALFQDREGSIWVLSSNALDRFTVQPVTYVTSREGLPNDIVPAVLTTRDGTTWISTFGGLATIRGDQVISLHLRRPQKVTLSLFEDSRSRLLVGSGEGRALWLSGGRTSPTSFPLADLLGGTQDKQKHLWLLDRDEGLVHADGAGDLVAVYRDLGNARALRSLIYDRVRDGIWLGSLAGELLFFKEGRVVARYGAANHIPPEALGYFWMDSDDALLMGTSTGLLRFLNGKADTLNSRNGLPCDSMTWVEDDGNGHKWLRMGCGLVEISESDFLHWEKDPKSQVKVEHFLDNTAGVTLGTAAPTYTPRSAMTSDGLLVFGSSAGLAVLDPQNLRFNALPPPVHIEAVFASGREYNTQPSLTLPTRSRDLQFAYTALSLVEPRKVRFRYELEGYDKGWSAPVSFRNVTYTNLPPGRYRFRVVACNNDGVWNEQGDAVALYIPPAFYQTRTFELLCLVAVGAIAYVAYQLRLRRIAFQLREHFWVRLQERERIARELHDSFFQSVHGLFLRLDAASTDLRADDSVRNTLHEILAQSDDVMSQGREVVTELRRGAGNIAELTTALSDFGAQSTSVHQARFDIQVSGESLPLQPGVSEEIEKITREAIRNAFQHAGATNIIVTIALEHDKLCVIVKDNGTGIEPSILAAGRRRGHFGLPGMHERARQFGARVSILNDKPSGTIVELTIPARHAYRKTSSVPWLRMRWRVRGSKRD